MAAVFDAGKKVFNVIRKSVNWVVDRVKDVADFVVDDIIRPVGRWVDDFRRGFFEDPLTATLKVAALVTGQAHWAWPLIDGINTHRAGGDFGDVLEATAKSYIAQKVGAEVGDFVGANAPFSADIANQMVVAGAEAATRAAIYGESITDAFVTGSLAAGIDTVIGTIGERLGVEFEVTDAEGNTVKKFLPTTVQNIISSTAAAALTGDLTDEDIANAVSRSLLTAEFMANVTSSIGIEDPKKLAYITAASQRVLSSVLLGEGGEEAGKAVMATLNAYGASKFHKLIDETFFGRALGNVLDIFSGDYQRTQEATNALNAVKEEWSTKYPEYTDWVSELDTLRAPLLPFVEEYQRLLEAKKFDTYGLGGIANEQFNEQLRVAEENLVNAIRNMDDADRFAELIELVTDANEDPLVEEAVTLEDAYNDSLDSLNNSSTNLDESLIASSTEIAGALALDLDPNFNAAEYLQLNNLIGAVSEADAAQHFVDNLHNSPITNAEDFQSRLHTNWNTLVNNVLSATDKGVFKLRGGSPSVHAQQALSALWDRFVAENGTGTDILGAIAQVNSFFSADQIDPSVQEDFLAAWNEIITEAGDNLPPGESASIFAAEIQDSEDAPVDWAGIVSATPIDLLNLPVGRGPDGSLIQLPQYEERYNGMSGRETVIRTMVSPGVFREEITTLDADGNPTTSTRTVDFSENLRESLSPEDSALVFMAAASQGNEGEVAELLDMDQSLVDQLSNVMDYFVNSDEWEFEARSEIFDATFTLDNTNVQNIIANTFRGIGGVFEAFGTTYDFLSSLEARNQRWRVREGGIQESEFTRFAQDLAAIGEGGLTEEYTAEREDFNDRIANAIKGETYLNTYQANIAAGFTVEQATAAAIAARDAMSTTERSVEVIEGIWGSIYDHPTMFLAEYIGVELSQELVPLLIGGAAATTAKGAAKVTGRSDEVAELLSRNTGLEAAFVSDVAEGFGSAAGGAYEQALEVAARSGMGRLDPATGEWIPNEQAHAYATNISWNAGLLQAVAILALNNVGGNALEQNVFGRNLPDTPTGESVTLLGRSADALLDRIYEGTSIFFKEGITEGVEEGLVANYVSGQLALLDPNIDVTGDTAGAAVMAFLAGGGTTGSIYGLSQTGDLASNLIIATDEDVRGILDNFESAYDAYVANGSLPEAFTTLYDDAATALNNAGITATTVINNILGTVAQDEITTTADVRDAIADRAAEDGESAYSAFTVGDIEDLQTADELDAALDTYIATRQEELGSADDEVDLDEEGDDAISLGGPTPTGGDSIDLNLNVADGDLDTALAALGTDIDDVETRLTTLINENDGDVDQAVADLSAELDTTETNLTNLIGSPGDDTNPPTGVFASLATGLAALGTDIDDVETRLTTLINENDGDVDQAIADLSAELDTTETNLTNLIGSPGDDINLPTGIFADIAGLTASLADLGTDISSVETRLTTLINANDGDVDQAVADLAAELGTTEANLSNTIGNLATSVAADIANLETGLAELGTDISSVETRLTTLINANDGDVDQAVADLAAELGTTETNLSNTIGNLATSVAADIANLETGLAELGTDISSVETRLTTLINANDGDVDQAVADLAAELDTTETNLSNTIGNLATSVAADIANLETGLAELGTDISSVETRLTTLINANDGNVDQAVADLAAELGTTETNLSNTIGNLATSVAADIANLETGLAELGTDISSVETRLTTLINANDGDVDQAVADLAAELGTTEANLSNTIGNLATSVAADIANLETGLAELGTDISSVETRLTTLINANDGDVDQAVADLAAELDTTETNLSNTIGNLATSVAADIANLETGLAELGTDISSVETRLTTLINANDGNVDQAVADLAAELGTTETNLSNTIGNLATSVAADIANLETGLAELGTDISSVETRLTTLINANDGDVDQAVADLAAELGTTEANLSNTIGNLATSVAADIANLETGLAELGTDISSVETRLTTLINANDGDVDQAVADLAAELDTTETNLSNTIGNLATSVAADIANLETGLAELGTDISSVETRLTTLINANDGDVDQAIAELAAELGTTETNLSNTIGNLATSVAADIANLETGLAELGTDISSVETRLTTLINANDGDVDQAIAELAAELGTTETNLSNTIGNLATSVAADIANLETGLAELGTDISSVETRLTTLINANDGDVDQAIAELAAELGTTETNLSNTIGNLATSVAADIANLETGLAELGTDISSVETRLTELIQDQGLSTDEAIVALAVELDTTETNLTNLVGDLATDVAADIANLETGLADLGTDIGEVETELTKLIQDQGLSTDEAIAELAGDLGTTETNLTNLVGDLATDVAADIETLETGLADLGTDIGEVETELTKLIQDQGLSTDEAIAELAGDLGTTETNLTNLVGDLATDVAADIETLETGLADLGTDIGEVETELTKLIQDQGLSTDEAIAELAGDLGTTETNLTNLVGDLATDVAADIAGVTEDIADVADVLGTPGRDDDPSTPNVDESVDPTGLFADIAAKEEAGMQRDAAIESALSDLSVDLDISIEEVLERIDLAETTLGESLTGTEAALASDIDAVADLVGKPRQDVTATDIDFVADVIAQNKVLTENQLALYDVTGDGQITIEDRQMLDDLLAGRPVDVATTSPFAGPTGIYAAIDANTERELAAIDASTATTLDALTDTKIDLQTDFNRQLQQEQKENLLMDVLSDPASMRREVSVTTPPPTNIDYLYDFGSIFATPQQEGLFVSPYGTDPQGRSLATQLGATTDQLLGLVGPRGRG